MYLLLLLALFSLLLTASTGFFQERAKTQPASQVIQERHVSVYYEASIPKAKAQLVSAGIEATYVQMVVKEGFRSPPQKKVTLRGSLEGASPDFLKCVGPHEFFHGIQFQYPLKLADNFFIEGTAMWAMQAVFPECRETVTVRETYEDWLVGGTDYSRLKLILLGYQGGLFWDFLANHHGGAQLIRRLFEHPDIRQGVAWPEVLGTLVGRSFFDLWSDFAVAVAARQVPDAKGLYALAEQETQYVPVPAFVGDWRGQSLTIDQVNWKNPFVQFCEEKKRYCLPAQDVATIGSPLIVRHPYGIHFLRIVPKSNEPFVLRFEGASDTDFRVHLVVLNDSGVYESFSLTQACIVSEPMAYKLLQVVITRGEKGSGSYKLIMNNIQNNQYPQCFSEKK